MLDDFFRLAARTGAMQGARINTSEPQLMALGALAFAISGIVLAVWLMAKITAKPPYFYVDESDWARGGAMLALIAGVIWLLTLAF